MGYTFARTQNSTSSETRTILLPYGTWKVYYTTSTSTGGSSGTGTSGWSSLNASQLTPKSNVVTSGMVSGNQVILDPRAAG
jgi:DNA/RNA endonuclease G (NUC1)